MSDESEDLNVAPPKDNIETPEQKESTSEIDASKGERWDHTEFTKEQQMRFNRIYGQMKRGQQIQEQLLADNKALYDKLSRLEASMTEKEVNGALKDLRKAKANAVALGDVDRASEIEDEIDQLKDKYSEAKKSQEEENKKREEEAKKAAEEYTLPETTQEAIRNWALEKDDEGNYIRPFANPAHPQHKKFTRIVQTVLTDEDAAGMNEEQIFKAVDTALEAFGLLKSKPKKSNKDLLPSVLPGLSSSKSRDTSKPLTETEKYIAKRMFPNDPKAEEKYAMGRKI